MPTGYTASLEQMDFDLKKWLLTRVIRNFGLCIHLRDIDFNLTFDEIEKRIVDDSGINYYTNQLENSKKGLEKMKSKNDEEWIIEYNLEKEKKKRKFAKDKNLKTYKQEKYLQTLEKLQILNKKPIDEEMTKNAVKFAIDQLHLVRNDYDDLNPNYYTVESNWENYKYNVLDKLQEDVDYYEKKLNEEKDRYNRRIRCFKKYVDDINKFL